MKQGVRAEVKKFLDYVGKTNMTIDHLELHMETSSGVILVNLGTVLLLQYPQGHWDLPKGHIEDTDSGYLETARRELKEETGISEFDFVSKFEERTEYTYHYKGKKRTKQVFWYLAVTEKISIKLSKEHRNYMWLDWSQAIELVTHGEAKRILKSAQSFMEANGLD
jgi:8-oxo-dGTP pyrophosphatase MutT (NUDIX family)